MKRRLVIIVTSRRVADGCGRCCLRPTRAGSAQPHHRARDARTYRQRGRRHGHLEAVTTVEVGSQVSGTIQSLGADFNSIVEKGTGARPA